MPSNQLHDEEPEEFQPPGYIRSLGAPVFRENALRELQELAPRLAETRDTPPLSGSEAFRLLIDEAHPAAFYTDTKSAPPELKPHLLCASSEGSVEDAVRQLEQIKTTFSTSAEPVVLKPVSSVTTLFLNIPGTPHWSPFGFDAEGSPLVCPSNGSGLGFER